MEPIVEGKTKTLFPLTVLARAKDRVTWDNRHEVDMPGKAVWSTETTCNVFRLFQSQGQQVAYISKHDETSFAAPYCQMVALEVVGRSVIDPKSSIKKRRPELETGVVLDEPIVEFFLKSSKGVFRGITLPDDDPLVVYPGGIASDGFYVVHPASFGGTEAVKIPFEVFGYEGDFVALLETLRRPMLDLTVILRDAWARLGWQLGDWKGEFGFDLDGNLLLADVVDNDSWRLRDPEGIERSKQMIRDAWRALDKTGKSDAELYGLQQAMVATAAYSFELVAETSKRLVTG